MVAEHVKLALFGPSLGYREGVHQPFGDRVAGAANKTGGSVLFDIRVDGDTWREAVAHARFGYQAHEMVESRLSMIGQVQRGRAVTIARSLGDISHLGT
ncbi:hypothetical protein CK215_25750 [Mesorhizobium sp. WSM3864]|nr:hypothetical protein CK215_25750 [Mesorhizobium sp. WSM3864]